MFYDVIDFQNLSFLNSGHL